jgi:D-3-phosphoglycerate dehydrogenase / 2-oxoglutarate reductase
MKIVIPDDYQNLVDRLECYNLIRHHEIARYREPARDLDHLIERLADADVVVSIRERIAFTRALLERLPKLKLIALVGRNSQAIDFKACTELGIPVSTGQSNSPVAPAELTVALILAARRNVAVEAERMKRGDWPCTLSHRLRGSTLGIFGLGTIGCQ